MAVLAFLGGSMGGGEIVLILLVALLLFGANNLPRVARTLGKTLEQIRRAANEVRDEVMKADAEAPEHTPPALPKPRPPEENSDDRVAR